MDYSKQVINSEIINTEKQIERDKRILKAYQQNVYKKKNDIFVNNVKLEQLKRSLIHE